MSKNAAGWNHKYFDRATQPSGKTATAPRDVFFHGTIAPTHKIKYNLNNMSRILFEPKRRLLVRIFLAFALVLAIQAGFSNYMVFTTMGQLMQSNIDNKLLRIGRLAVNDPLVEKSLRVTQEDHEASAKLGALSNFLLELTSLVDIRGAYLYRVAGVRFIYLAGTLTPDSLDKIPTPYLTNIDMQALVSGRPVTGKTYRQSGKLIKAVYVPLLAQDKLIGLLSIEDDAQDYELLAKLKHQLMLTAAGAFLIVVVASFVIAQTMVRPIRKLVDAAEKIGMGDFSVRYKVSGTDEINFLGQTVNDMAEDIRARDAEIRRMNEAALADARQLYEHVLRAAYSAILTANNDDVLTSENPAAAKLLGDPPAAPTTMSERLAPFPALWEIWREKKTMQPREITIQRDGAELALESNIALLTDHRNEPIGHSLTLVDRTELKRLENELVMRERLAALGELAAGIAHEIRNPLNGIELMLGLVQEDLREKGVMDERFIRIHDEVSRLNSILTEFLAFARPKPLEKTPADLVELTEDAIMLLLPAIEEKQIEIVRRYDSPLPPAVLDPGAIRRVLVNLIKNACEAMPPGGRVYLAIQGPETTGGGFRVEVRDSGPGISPEVRDRIFHPFVTTKSDGTGLGLAIVHKAIVNHGGSISCHNHPEGGACFVVALPV